MEQARRRRAAIGLARFLLCDEDNSPGWPCARRRQSDAEEFHVAVAMMVDNPGRSQEAYDKFREHLGLADAPAGGILHVAGPSPNGGCRVIEVWESEEHAKRFVEEQLRPAFEAVGLTAPPRPEFWPVHSYMT
jgi:hypothetical protein